MKVLEKYSRLTSKDKDPNSTGSSTLVKMIWGKRLLLLLPSSQTRRDPVSTTDKIKLFPENIKGPWSLRVPIEISPSQKKEATASRSSPHRWGSRPQTSHISEMPSAAPTAFRWSPASLRSSLPGLVSRAPFPPLLYLRKEEDRDLSSEIAHRVHSVLQLGEPIRHVPPVSEGTPN